MNNGKSIGRGKYVILVYGKELGKASESKFYKWLCADYSNASNHGYWECCPWVYINLQKRTFFSGMPGIKITDCLKDHAVTVDEFYRILEVYEKNPQNFNRTKAVISIYEKYKGKDIFVFNKTRFDCD